MSWRRPGGLSGATGSAGGRLPKRYGLQWIDMIHFRPMTQQDIGFAMSLKDQAGWNQCETDWRRLIELQPDGCFIALDSDRPVATVATTLFDSVGWISMLLVNESDRGRGIGAALMERALSFLDSHDAQTVRLDATPLGQPLYEKLGFAPEYELARFSGKVENAPARSTVGPTITPTITIARADQLPAMIEFDRIVTGTNRYKLLKQLHAENPDLLHVKVEAGQIQGYAAMRRGSLACQIGPVIAGSQDAGRMLCEAALVLWADGQVIIDIPLANQQAVQWAQGHGFSIQRSLMRMFRGLAIDDKPENIWACFGPEKG